LPPHARSATAFPPLSSIAILPAAALLVAARAMAQPTASDTQKVVIPAGARSWTFTNGREEFGHLKTWRDASGVRLSHEVFQERSTRFELSQRLSQRKDGTLEALTVEGTGPEGKVAESYRTDGKTYTFKSSSDAGTGRVTARSFYLPLAGTADATFALAEWLVAHPRSEMRLAPSGAARLERLANAQVRCGGRERKLTAYLISGLDLTPQPIWFEGRKAFGNAGPISLLPNGCTGLSSELQRRQESALEQRETSLARQLARRHTGPVLLEGGRLFDAKAGRFLDGQSVLVNGKNIERVGPAGSFAVPAGTLRLSARGMTILPGLWDSHKHMVGTSSGALLLSAGITTVRDMGTLPDVMVRLRSRIDAGELLGPRILPLMVVDGPGPTMNYTARPVSSPEDARAAAQEALDKGYLGLKIYNSLEPGLVQELAREAKRLGLRLQGHMPAGTRPLHALEQGYDELTHANHALLQFAPNSVLSQPHRDRTHFGPARFAAELDLNSEQVRSYVAELKRRGAAVDPTLSVTEMLWTLEPGEMPPALSPYAKALPVQFQRGLRQGGYAPPAGLTRDQMRRGHLALRRFVGALHAGGVPIVAGTDGFGLEIARELELYVEAGLTPAEALRSATIVPATIMGKAGTLGSIEPGKLADLVLVGGDPARDVGAVRDVRMVMKEGIAMDPVALARGAGLAVEDKEERP
jgi:cytosine/adenosine deaminase-related metal-dependent hydrolase